MSAVDYSKTFIYINDHWLALSAIETLHYDEVKKIINVRTIANNTFRVSANAANANDAAAYAREWMLSIMNMVRSRRSGDEEIIQFPSLDSTF